MKVEWKSVKNWLIFVGFALVIFGVLWLVFQSIQNYPPGAREAGGAMIGGFAGCLLFTALEVLILGKYSK